MKEIYSQFLCVKYYISCKR